MVTKTGPMLNVTRYALLIAILTVMVFPLGMMFYISLSKAIPDGAGLSFDAYFDLFATLEMTRYLFNSVFVGLVVTLGNILFGFMVAYSLARYNYLGNRMLFLSVIGVLMIPAHVVIIPMYILCLKTGLYDTYWALILPWLVNPIGIFLVKQYIESLPISMEEAARIDGAGELRILFQVVMPMCKPALAVLAIQVFFTNWNSFLFPFILTSSDRLRTLPVALALFQGHQGIDWPHLMAGSAVAVIPVLVLFVIMQRQIVSGITAGAIKQ